MDCWNSGWFYKIPDRWKQSTPGYVVWADTTISGEWVTASPLSPRHKVGHFLLQIFVYFFLDIVYYNTRQYFSILMMVKNYAYCKQTSIVNKYFADSGMLCYNTRLGCLTRDHQELLSSIRDVHYFLGQSFDRFPSYCFYPTKFYRDFEQSYGIVRKAVCIAPPVIFLFIHASRNDFRKIDNPHLYCFYHS